jgi:AcrR family transcriptional regulator
MTEKDARTLLLEAALPLFATKGFAAVTFKEISEASGVNSALINYYFKSKEGLYEAVLVSQFSKFQTRLLQTSLQQSEPKDRIELFIKTLVQIHQENPHVRRLITMELTQPSKFFESMVKKYISKISEFLNATICEGIAKGQFREDLEPAFVAPIMVGAINFFFIAEPVVRIAFNQDYSSGKDDFALQAIKVYFEGILKDR